MDIGSKWFLLNGYGLRTARMSKLIEARLPVKVHGPVQDAHGLHGAQQGAGLGEDGSRLGKKSTSQHESEPT